MGPTVDSSLLDIRLDLAEMPSLMDWLRNDPELRVWLRLKVKTRVSGGVADATVQILSVAMGSGGVGAVLAGALSTWLSQRHSDLKLTISDQNGRRVEMDARRVRDVPELLNQVAQMLDEAKPGEPRPGD